MNLEKYGLVTSNHSLVNENTFKIACICDYYILVNDANKLKELIMYLKDNNIKYFVIGGGSNIVLPDHYSGVVIKLDFKELKMDKTKIEVGASYYFNKLAIETVNKNLAGLEWAAGIPGMIGGSIAGNAGAYGDEIMNYVTKIEVLENGEVKTLFAKDIKYGYRYTSVLKAGIIILKAYLNLKKGSKEELSLLIKENTAKRVLSQPLEYPSAGSIFRNPEGNYAGKLIEEAGLKGYRLGGAMVSEKHANFIINYEKATGEDILNLINHVHAKVLEVHGIDLIIEPQIIN
jgi:UDP-N-acetylmuramate dehydrogenase